MDNVKTIFPVVEARTFDAADEKEFWDWLGDAYLSSSDFSDGETGSTSIHIQTPMGEAIADEGDVIVKREDGFYVLSPEDAEECLKELDKALWPTRANEDTEESR